MEIFATFILVSKDCRYNSEFGQLTTAIKLLDIFSIWSLVPPTEYLYLYRVRQGILDADLAPELL